MPGMVNTTPTPTSPVARRAIDTIVINCSATHSGQPLGNGTYGSAAAVIDRWHASRGFARQSADVQRYNPSLKSIGYHFVIDVDGTCEIGRSIQEVGAHAAGNNAHSIGICIVGGLERDALYTPEQWAMLADLVRSLKTPSISRIVGHRDLSPDANNDGVIDSRDWLKTCPGFDVREWLAAGMKPLAKHVFAGGNHHD